ncbi:unnamed protein product [Ixodes pacificus]
MTPVRIFPGKKFKSKIFFFSKRGTCAFVETKRGYYICLTNNTTQNFTKLLKHFSVVSGKYMTKISVTVHNLTFTIRRLRNWISQYGNTDTRRFIPAGCQFNTIQGYSKTRHFEH